MKDVAIFMSDLHLGQNDQMEEFYADVPFVELIERLSTEHAGDTVDLVLLGDVMDLWTTITDQQEGQARSTADIPLYFPVAAGDVEGRARAVEYELQKVRAIAESHCAVFEALGRFLIDDPGRRRLLYIPGNHDHSVVAPELQGAIRDAILSPTVIAKASEARPTVASRIEFPNWYENASLQVYAEHGNQLTYGRTYRYEDFSSFGSECPGYYPLKLIWNRLERRHPDVDNVFMSAFKPAQWPSLLWWLLIKGNWKGLRQLRAFQREYDRDVRPAVQWARQQIPAAWKSYWHLFTSSRFSAVQDEFGSKVPGLFTGEDASGTPISGKPLDPSEIKTVILGHSHHARDKNLPELEGVKYYNLGSWIFQFDQGRRVIEQTWVRISRDNAAAESPLHVNREMICREVELLGSAIRPRPNRRSMFPPGGNVRGWPVGSP